MERMDVRRDLFSPRKWSDRIASHAVPSRNASRSGPSVQAALEHEVDKSGLGTFILSCPLFQGIAPEAPKLRNMRGDFGPIVVNEEEIVAALWQSAEVRATSIRVPTEDDPENFWRYASGYVQ